MKVLATSLIGAAFGHSVPIVALFLIPVAHRIGFAPTADELRDLCMMAFSPIVTTACCVLGAILGFFVGRRKQHPG